MYCILKVRNDADKDIEKIIGPIADLGKALGLADNLQNQPSNYWYGSRFHNFYVRHMEQSSEEYR
jgi:hypothetical protein